MVGQEAYGRVSPRGDKQLTSQARREANQTVRLWAREIEGSVLSIGSGDDSDGEGRRYRDYFPNCTSYKTSETTNAHTACDMILDVRDMSLPNESVDCIFCSAVLEHVDDIQAAMNEMTRILCSGGILLLGVPFRQPIHMAPNDYWRFTEHGILYLLRHYHVMNIVPLDHSVLNFPSAYWARAQKPYGVTNDN